MMLRDQVADDQGQPLARRLLANSRPSSGGKDNLQRMLAVVPLTDDERTAVDDGQTALDQLLDRLADVPTPAGPTPRHLGVRATGTLLPIVDVHQGEPRRTTP